MPVRTRRFNDPALPDDGYRVLVTRYRPRGIRREDETWDTWWPNLGPSAALHAAVYGKSGPPISWEEYRDRYLAEIASQGWWLRGLGDRVAAGETITLLCSSACVDETKCHRSLLRALIEAPEKEKPRDRGVVRRSR